MTPKDVAENYWRLECTRDISAILSCYEHNAELIVPGLGRLIGHEQIGLFYQASIDRFPGLHVDIVNSIINGDHGAFEWRSIFTDHEGRTFRSKGSNFIRIAGDRFLSVHVYFDPTDLQTSPTEASA